MYTYKITYLLGKLDNSICPPAVLSLIFPSFDGDPVTLNENEITVTFTTEQIPVDLPLVKVELL